MAENRITAGNDFILKIDLQQKSSNAEATALPASSIADLAVAIVSSSGRRTIPAFEVDADNDNVLVVHVDGKAMGEGQKAVEITGLINGHNVRGFEHNVFDVKHHNGEQNIDFMPYEGEEGGVLRMSFVVLADNTPTAEWEAKLEALQESVTANNAVAVENEKVRQANEEVRQKQEKKREALRKMVPKIEDGTWWTWDAEAGEYKDTGLSAVQVLLGLAVDPDDCALLVETDAQSAWVSVDVDEEKKVLSVETV